MQDKYEALLERSVLAMERQSSVLEAQKEVGAGIAKISEQMNKNLGKLNDNFILHSTNSEADRKLIKEQMLKWIKTLATLLFIVVGGSTAIVQLKNLI